MPSENINLQPYRVVIFDWEGTLGEVDQLLPGAELCVKTLFENGYRLAIATNKSSQSLLRDLAETKLSAYFESTRCADQTSPKPHPQMLQEILLDLDVSAQDAIMIGDSESDIIMASYVKMDAIGIDLRGHFGASLSRAGAKTVVNTYTQLLEVLVKSNS